jgi:putative FmdB family regulatory protein
MPTYTYLCPVHDEFDEYHSITMKLTHCPKCKEEGKDQEVKRLISSGGSKGIVELTGHELVAKTKKDAQKLKRDVYSSEKLYANVIGTDRYEGLQKRIDRNK